MRRRRRQAIAVLLGAGLMVCSGLAARESFVFVDVGRENVCAPETSAHCFVQERAVVVAGDGSGEFTVRSRSGTETVGPYNGSWDGTPPAGTAVVLERWEGDEIAYVFVPTAGSRYKTRLAPDRETPAMVAVLLVLLGVAIPRDIAAGSRRVGPLRAPQHRP